jgi:hypothetical protein
MTNETDEFEEFDFDDLDDMEEEMMEMEEDEEEMMSNLYINASSNAMKLAELVVENNHLQQEKMTEEDIYAIYTRSFVTALSVMQDVVEE